ncbi:phage tail spike protein [Geobacillus thermodenitrificans]|uniref:phage tail spike protein n=1 Tax=Geobacillus thermodenitrificans TaxID=33940 RepID=UPI003D1D1AD2
MIHVTDSQTDRILAVIDEDSFWNDKHYKSLKDTVETFDFVTFGDRDFSDFLSKRNRIVIPDEDGRYVEFIIENTREYHDFDGVFVEVYTVASYLSLAKAKIISPRTLSDQTPSTAVSYAIGGTEWEAGRIANVGRRTFHIEKYTNPLSFLRTIATEFGLELRFRVEIDHNKVARRYVDLVERVGEWRGREVEFGKDLVGIERKVDDSNIVTALVGLGPERDDGTQIEVFVADEDALQRWGRPNPQTGQLMHLIETYEPVVSDEEVTEDRIRELTQNELEKRINSLVEYKADVIDLEKVIGLEHEKFFLGDTVRIKDTFFYPPLYIEARVHTIERSIKENGEKTVTLGDFIEYTEEDVLAIWRSLQTEIAKKISMQDVMEVTYTKPEIDAKDSSVYQDSTQYTDVVAEAKKQEAIQVATEDATQKANQAEQNAKQYTQDYTEQKKWEAIQQAIAEAEQKVNQAKAELENEIAAKADVQWVNGQLVLKENVITKSNTAPTNPTNGQLWLDTSVVPNVLKRWNGSAWVKVTPTTAGEVGAYTKTEVDNALNSKVSVTQYTADMNGVVTRLNSAESRITQNEQEISSKVSNTTYQQDKTTINNSISQLQTKMSNAETSITQLSSEIALKANKTDVYTKSQIDGQFNTVNQQISQLDAELSVQADQIATKVSRTEFESLQIGGRNLVKNSTGDLGLDGWRTINSGGSLAVEDGYGGHKAITRSITASGGGVYTPFANVEAGKVYTLSFWVKTDKNATVSHLPKFKDANGTEINPISAPNVQITANTWTRITFTLTIPANQVQMATTPRVINGEYPVKLWVSQYKLEQGNRATDWTPAPEDTQSQIDGLGSRVTTAETSITQLANQIALKANQTTVDTIAGQINNLQAQLTIQAGQIATKVEKNGIISAINQTAEQIKIQASKVDLSGYVTFTNLSTAGQTIIDGGNLKANSVAVSKLAAGTINADIIGIANNKIRLDSTGLYVYKSGVMGASLVEGNLTFFDQTNGQKIGMFAATVWSDGTTKGISMNMEASRYISFGRYVNATTGYAPMLVLNPGTAMAGVPQGIVANLPIRMNDDLWMGTKTLRFGLNNTHNHSALWHDTNNNLTIASYTGIRLAYLTSGGVANDRLTVDENSVDVWQDLDLHGWKLLRVAEADFMSTARIAYDSSATYVQHNTEVRATKYKSTTYVPVRASSFPTGSLAEYKQDIHVWEESALEKIRSATIYEYRLKSEVEAGKDRWRQGLVIGEGYNTPVGVIDGDGVEQYLMNAWSWKAIQELDSIQTNHSNRIAWLELENQYLKQKVSQLETRITELEAKIA